MTPRLGITEEPSQTDEPLFTWRPEPTATPKSSEVQVAENITVALPDLDGMGSAELKGPELNIAGNQFNLFKTKIGMSLPVFNNIQINIDHKNHTAEVPVLGRQFVWEKYLEKNRHGNMDMIL